jgi:Protein of unknown function (DUF1264)
MHRIALTLIAIFLTACGGGNTDSRITVPGIKESATTQALEVGADLLQEKSPLRQLNAYLNGFHFYNGNLDAQMEAHHYCGHLNEDVIQCVIFDGNEANAKLMGVEYIVSRSVFMQLPVEEKHLWHSHVHEVRSGQLIAPGIPAVAEHALMQQIIGTYGKTWHTWHTDQAKSLPIGVPTLMMGFTADGQAKHALIQERDQRFQVSSAEKRDARRDIATPSIDPEADAWQKGATRQLDWVAKPRH